MKVQAQRVTSLRADYQAMHQMFLSEPRSFDEMLAILREAKTILDAA